MTLLALGVFVLCTLTLWYLLRDLAPQQGRLVSVLALVAVLVAIVLHFVHA